MTKLFIAGILAMTSINALAEINCLSTHGDEALEIRVIDTFIDRTAFIKRIHPNINFPAVGIPVKSFEKTKSINFVNLDHDFHLSVDKQYPQRSLPPSYKAELNFFELSADMDCYFE